MSAKHVVKNGKAHYAYHIAAEICVQEQSYRNQTSKSAKITNSSLKHADLDRTSSLRKQEFQINQVPPPEYFQSILQQWF